MNGVQFARISQAVRANRGGLALMERIAAEPRGGLSGSAQVLPGSLSPRSRTTSRNWPRRASSRSVARGSTPTSGPSPTRSTPTSPSSAVASPLVIFLYKKYRFRFLTFIPRKGDEMAKVLHLDASPRGERSHSRRLSKSFVNAWLASHPGDPVTYRDLGHNPVPLVNEPMIAAAFTPPPKPDRRKPFSALKISNELIDELFAHDIYIFGIPMYNFGVPAGFKAYIDQIVMVGPAFTDARLPGPPQRQADVRRDVRRRGIRGRDADGQLQLRTSLISRPSSASSASPMSRGDRDRHQLRGSAPRPDRSQGPRG